MICCSGKLEGQRTLEDSCKCKDNIKMDIEEI